MSSGAARLDAGGIVGAALTAPARRAYGARMPDRLRIEPIEIAGPLEAARALQGLPYPFLLHSGAAGAGARWSFFGAEPFLVGRGADYGPVRAEWRRLSPRYLAVQDAIAPFQGGAVGYWAYDYGRRLEEIRGRARDDLGFPDVVIGLYDVVGAFDHQELRAWLFSSGLPLRGVAGARRAERRLRRFADRLSARSGVSPDTPSKTPIRATCTFTPDGYRRTVERIREHIRAGDIFQANLSQRWTLPVPAADPHARSVALIEALAHCSPAPHAACFGAGDHAIASASPERFLVLRSGRVETRPIKGTRPRSKDPAEDLRLAAALLASEKDRAENVMIVDVLRNDLGRACTTGSIEVTGLCELETFAQVHHLTSTVAGSLEPGVDAFDLLDACMPGGSITGAPKIRAMELLDQLEPVRRHIYTGSLGYVDWRGDADWNIAIRTALVSTAAVHFAAGGGITSESDPDQEYLETLHKAEGMRLALGQVVGPLDVAPTGAVVG